VPSTNDYSHACKRVYLACPYTSLQSTINIAQAEIYVEVSVVVVLDCLLESEVNIKSTVFNSVQNSYCDRNQRHFINCAKLEKLRH